MATLTFLSKGEATMDEIEIPVRYYKDYQGGYEHGFENLVLPFAESAFLLVDVDGSY